MDSGFLLKRIEKLEEIVKDQQNEIDHLKTALGKMNFNAAGQQGNNETSSTTDFHIKERKLSTPIQFKYSK